MYTIRSTDYDFNTALDIIEPMTAADLGREITAPRWSDFDGPEYALRYARLAALMKAEGILGTIFTQEENVRYFTGYMSVLWISRFRPVITAFSADTLKDTSMLVTAQEFANASGTAWVDAPRMFSPQVAPIPGAAQMIRDIIGDSGKIGIELGFGQRLGMNIEQFTQLQDELPGVEFVDITPLAETVRMLKSEAEIDRIRTAAEISTAAVKTTWENLKVGMTERDIATSLGKEMYGAGAEVSATKQSVWGIMAGKRIRHSNAVADDTEPLEVGDRILIDGGATYKGYVTDFIRVASFGPVNDVTNTWYDISHEANSAALAAIQPGVVARDVYEAAIDVYRAHGLEAYNATTIIGHGIGADIHELPWLGAEGVYTSQTRLRAGMVLSIEPVLGIRLGAKPPTDEQKELPVGIMIVEEMVVVREGGVELLTGGVTPEIWIVPVDGE
jgi:Xaa-Pro dipeptidase